MLPLAVLAAAIVVAGCARQGPSPSTAGTEGSAIAKAEVEEAKARAAEAKAKAAEAAAKAEKAKADAKRARADAAKAAKAPAGSTPEPSTSYSSPSIWISCNGQNLTRNVYFGGDWHVSTATATLRIDYGDGRHYTTSHIPYFRSAYRHTYPTSGDFLVNIRLIDGRGNVATDSCLTSVGWD